MTTLVLVNPPFFDVQRPSLALGTLKAILDRGDIETKVLYANLSYAESIGLYSYEYISRLRVELNVGDWLFGAAAFPELDNNPIEYLSRLVQSDAWEGNPADLVPRLLLLRENALVFVDNIVDQILALNPTLVGCTSTFSQHVAALAILRRVRERSPDVTTLLGGANCESIMGETTHRNFPWVDYVVSGEAEDLIVSLCRRAIQWRENIPLEFLPYGVFGPIHRISGYPKSSAANSSQRASVVNLNSVPTPDYSDYFSALSVSKYSHCIAATLPMETSRGCWWGAVSHCTFCGLNGNHMGFRSKQADLVLKQINELVSKYETPRIEMVDNILDYRYFDSVLPQLAADSQKVAFFYEVKSNLTRAHIRSLAAAGVRVIQPGIESLDTRVLKLMKKGVSSFQNIRLLKWARQYGINVQWATIYGFPGENDAWYDETSRLLPMLFHLQPGGSTRLRFDRFSPYHTDPSKFGLDLVPYWQATQIYPLNATDLANQSYFFENASDFSVRDVDGRVVLQPGTKKYLALCQSWRERWTQRPRAVCTIIVRNGERLLFDTRPMFFGGARTVTPLMDHILAVADDGIVLDRLVENCTESRSWSSKSVELEVTRLINAGLLIVVDGKALSVVLRAPVEPIDNCLAPLGMVSIPKSERSFPSASTVN